MSFNKQLLILELKIDDITELSEVAKRQKEEKIKELDSAYVSEK